MIKHKIAIIGSGSWGTALAIKAVNGGNDTYLYCRTPSVADTIRTNKENTEYLPGVAIPDDLHVVTSVKEAVEGARIVLLVTPSSFVEEAAQSIKPYVSEDAIVVIASKGLHRQTGQLLTSIVEEVLHDNGCGIAVISGPNHAEEVGAGLPAAAVIGCDSETQAVVVQEALKAPDFRLYTSTDMLGIEIAGATKNIIALAAGIVDGLQLGDNCKALLLTRGLHEMTRFGVHLGAHRETFAGLAGMGDLVATCMSQHSRNRWAGQQLSTGLARDEIIGTTNMVVEGFVAVDIVYKKAQEQEVPMPITEALHQLLNGQITAQEALNELMTRHSKGEIANDLTGR